MHALLVMFRPEVSEQKLMETVGPKMKKLATQPGLIMKTFVGESAECLGGFYLFESKETADAYLKGEFFQWLSNSDLISNVEIKQFVVEDEPSKMFGTPSVPLAKSAAA